jgi:hydroxypyruvate isomerase
MYRFAANLSFLFAEHEFADRFAAAAAAGFRGVEFMFPYAQSIDRLAGELRANGLEMVLFNLPPGDWERGERGIASLPGRRAEFREGLAQALAVARQLGCRRLNCLAGRCDPSLASGEQRECLVANLREAAAACTRDGVQLLLEPINSRIDMPGFFLDDFALALSCLEEAAAPGLALQFDAYHAQVIDGDAAALCARCRPHIGHVQIADHPGRHEPGSGAIDWPRLRAALAGYHGWIGCEYRPLAGTLAGLGWRQGWQQDCRDGPQGEVRERGALPAVGSANGQVERR